MPLDQEQDLLVPRRYGDAGALAGDVGFLNMYLRDVRGVDYVASRPDWDGRTLVLKARAWAGSRAW